MAAIEYDRLTIPDHLEVRTNEPLVDMETWGAWAFQARDSSRSKRRVYALVQKPGVPPRAEVFRKLARMPAVNMVNPLCQAVLPLEIDGKSAERLVTILDDPGSAPVLSRSKGGGKSIPFPTIRHSILPACVRAISALHSRNVYHRAIRPDAVFMSGTNNQEFFLGECISAPPGAGLPMAFEPLERALAHPLGRGEGDEQCDLYALGVTLLSLFFGEVVGADVPDNVMLEARINQGSFWALSRGRDIPGALGILMRGLLSDDPEDRWTLQDLTNWMDGAVPGRRSGMRSWGLARPVKFKGKMYTDRRYLAHAFASDERKAAEFLRKTDFSNWIQQIISTELFTEKLDRLLDVRPEMDLSASGSSDSKLVSRVCSFLDPRGPIRYRGLSFMLDGIGPLLANAFAEGDEKAVLAFDDVLRGNLLETLVDIILEKHRNYKNVYANLTPTLQMMKDLEIGGGLEYALYSFHDGVPCLSEKFHSHYVNSLGALVVTFDEVTRPDASSKSLLDAHVMGYIAARGRSFDGIFKRMTNLDNDPQKLMPTVMEVFSVMQQSAGGPPLNTLSKVLLGSFRPVIKKLKSRSTRKQVEAQMTKLEGIGNLSTILQQVNLSTVLLEDEDRFRKAQATAQKLAADLNRMQQPVSPRELPIQQGGYRFAVGAGYVAVTASLALSVLTLLG
ncbi:MAG: hypothetical protein ACFB22_08115 [Rhodothalassiaceae bacterium]